MMGEQEDKGYPEQPVRAAKGHRPSQAHVGEDEGQDDEKTRLAEGMCQPHILEQEIEGMPDWAMPTHLASAGEFVAKTIEEDLTHA
jgi:hypothetical protein